jgi:hypothetical protein
MIRAMLPKHGAMKGSQYFIITMSGFSLFSFRPTFIQDNGFIELTERSILKSYDAFSSQNCVFPGKRNDGYCNENV